MRSDNLFYLQEVKKNQFGTNFGKGGHTTIVLLKIHKRMHHAESKLYNHPARLIYII